ncbi:MAG TPA: PAS domain S-box protein [Terriglobales bacterium]|nr:PAS domain S-box protein [Terriglobales bacterium]
MSHVIPGHPRAGDERPSLLGLRPSQLAEAFTNLRAAIVVTNGPEHHIAFVNPAALQVLGIDREEDVVGKTVGEMLSEHDLRRYATVLDNVYRGGEPFIGSKEEVALPGDYSGEPQKKYFNYVCQPLRDDSGNVEGVLIHAIDVTEEVRAAKVMENKEAELRRQSNEARFLLAAIVDSSEDAIVSKNLDGTITSWNAGAQKIFGYSAEEAVGQPITMVIPPELQYQEAEILSRLRSGQRIEHFETVRVTKSGQRLNVSLTISPVRDSEGRIVGASKIARNITQSKHIETALRDSERRFRLAQAAAHIGTWEWDPAADSSALSPELHDMFGTSAADPQHKNIWESRVQDLPTVAREMENGVRNGEMEFEYRYSHPERGTRWFLCKGRRLEPDEHSQVGRMFGVIIDITERRQAEESLRRSEQQFRALADSIAQLVWMAEPDGHIFWYNQRWYAYTGTTPEDMVGWGWQSVHDPAMLPEVLRQWKASLASGEPFEMEFPLRGADGVFRWFLTRATPVRDQFGRVVRWFGTNTNVHEQREARQALQASQKQLNAALQALRKAHDELEIRVQERTEDLTRAEEGLRALSARLLQAQDEERRRIARELHDSAGQLLAALNMNLVPIEQEAAKLGPHAAKAATESVHLVEELSKELRTISHLLHPPMLDEAGLEFALQWYVDGFAERSHIAVDLEFASDLGRLTREMETTVFRLVQESLTNIHRHAESQTAKVRVFRQMNDLVAEVSDTGKGMRSANGDPVVRPGVGIQGMRERVRQLGGQLTIESGKGGTTVRAVLPISRAATERAG